MSITVPRPTAGWPCAVDAVSSPTGPTGDHAPRERELVRTSQWLDTQARMSRIAGAKDRINR